MKVYQVEDFSNRRFFWIKNAEATEDVLFFKDNSAFDVMGVCLVCAKDCSTTLLLEVAVKDSLVLKLCDFIEDEVLFVPAHDPKWKVGWADEQYFERMRYGGYHPDQGLALNSMDLRFAKFVPNINYRGRTKYSLNRNLKDAEFIAKKFRDAPVHL